MICVATSWCSGTNDHVVHARPTREQWLYVSCCCIHLVKATSNSKTPQAISLHGDRTADAVRRASTTSKRPDHLPAAPPKRREDGKSMNT